MVVESTLTALVEHFSQPIHQKTRKEEKEAPYFDELLGRPPEISPVVQHWLDQLQHKASQGDNNDTRLSWLKGYVRHIRPVLFCADNNQISPSGVPVLQQFELVLSQWQQQPQQPQKYQSFSKNHDTISHTLKTLANDISLLTEACSHDDDDYYSCRNMVLPTLLRLLAHGIPYSWEKDHDARRICSVALLLFGHSTIDPRHVEPSLLTESCLWQNVSYQDLSVDIGNNNWIDWTQVQLVGTAWDDPITGIATRAAQHGWKALLRVLLPLRADNKEMTCCCPDQVDWKRQVLQELGMSEMACAVRAHFFGRDDDHVLTTTTTTLSSSASTTPLSQRQYHHRPNKYPLELKPTKAPNDSFQKRPSRVHVALHFISLVTTTNIRDEFSHVLEHVLPICYALLDYSTTLKHVAMGAAALLHLFQIMNTTTANADFKYWTDCKEMLLLDVLERTCRTTREGPAVFLVCLAQSHVFTIFPHRKKERRRATQHLLTILYRNSYSQNNDSLHLGLLMGGIIPLLQQHANNEQQQEAVPADAMELGRLGLVTLLPLLRWNSSSVQLPALVALIHLMMGAYPILPRHGGKIMCELLACLGHAAAAAAADGEQEISIIPMATTAAAIALVLCGERASAILDQVKPDEFDPMLVRYAQAIREEATRLRKEHKAI
jgi:hypothetical protein